MARAKDGSSPRGSLHGVRFSVVGPGKVGSSLTHWLVECGATLVEVGARHPERVEAWAQSLAAQAVPIAELGQSSRCSVGKAGDGESSAVDPSPVHLPDLLLIAVSDPAIGIVASQLSHRPVARVALHSSGSLGAEVLAPLAPATAIGSLHPLKAFPRVLHRVREAAGTLFAVDGTPPAVALSRRLAAAWGATTAEVPTAARPLYHFAATLAAGGVVTLLATADRIARQQGLDKAVTRGYIDLAIGALEAAREASTPSDAITGPLARGDLEIVGRQLNRLARADPATIPLCGQLAMETLRHLGLPPRDYHKAIGRLGLGKDDMNVSEWEESLDRGERKGR